MATPHLSNAPLENRLEAKNHPSLEKENDLGGGFKHFLFSPLPEKMIQFDEYFSNGLKPPTWKFSSIHLQV